MPMRRGVRCNSIVDTFRIPAVVAAIPVDSKQGSAHCDIPLFARPLPVVPPLSGVSPWSTGSRNVAMHAGKSDPCRHVFEKPDGSFERRPEDSQGAVGSPFYGAEVFAEMLHLESIARIGVGQRG